MLANTLMERVPGLSSKIPALPVFADGFGVRYLTLEGEDGNTGEPVEMLAFDRALVDAADFSAAVGARVTRLASARHTLFARVRRLDRPAPESLLLVSERVTGWRLADVLDVTERERIPFDISAVLSLLRQLIPAVALFARHQKDVAIGTIGPERLILTPQGRLVLTEYVLGEAVDKLALPRDQAWRRFRVPISDAGGAKRTSLRSDVLGIGIVVLSMLLGRRLRDDEFPKALGDLLLLSNESSGGQSRPLSPGLASWLGRALQLDDRVGFQTPQEAQVAFEEMLATERGYVTTPALLDALIARFQTVVGAPVDLHKELQARDKAEKERVDHERAERERQEQERAERERIEKARKEREERDRKEREARERKQREEQERKEREERERKEREERERKEREERARKEREERERREREERERKEAEERARKEREERERIEREERARKEREERERKEREERERKERERREREEQQRRERERQEKERKEQERKEKERQEREQREREERERRERAEREKRERIEREERERAENERERAERERRERETEAAYRASKSPSEQPWAPAQSDGYASSTTAPAGEPAAPVGSASSAFSGTPYEAAAYYDSTPSVYQHSIDAPTLASPDESESIPPAALDRSAEAMSPTLREPEPSALNDEAVPPSAGKSVSDWLPKALAALTLVVVFETAAIVWLWSRSSASLATQGELVVTSRPASARVMLDNQALGVTPVTVRRSPGTYTLKVQYGNSEPRVIVVQIRQGVQTAQYLELQAGR